jgi:hypothetical protein
LCVRCPTLSALSRPESALLNGSLAVIVIGTS